VTAGLLPYPKDAGQYWQDTKKGVERMGEVLTFVSFFDAMLAPPSAITVRNNMIEQERNRGRTKFAISYSKT
jgi:hypothetical protein